MNEIYSHGYVEMITKKETCFKMFGIDKYLLEVENHLKLSG